MNEYVNVNYGNSYEENKAQLNSTSKVKKYLTEINVKKVSHIVTFFIYILLPFLCYKKLRDLEIYEVSYLYE